VIGFKHKLTEVGDFQQFVEKLRRLQIKVVFLYRENLVKVSCGAILLIIF